MDNRTPISKSRLSTKGRISDTILTITFRKQTANDAISVFISSIRMESIQNAFDFGQRQDAKCLEQSSSSLICRLHRHVLLFFCDSLLIFVFMCLPFFSYIFVVFFYFSVVLSTSMCRCIR